MGVDRVAITGTGVICASGVGSEAFTDAIVQGRVGLTPIEGFDLSPFDGRYAGVVHDFDPSRGDPDAAVLDRHVQLAVVAAEEAVEQSGALQAVPPERRALVMATCNGGWLSIERHHRMLHGLETGEYDEALDLAKRHYSAALELARRHAVAGPVLTVVTACSASTNAIGLARDLLRTGRADVVLAGGADSFSATTFAGFDRLKTTSVAPCAPFSTPVGLNLGEGAGFWVLESESQARSRGAESLGFVLGYGTSNDAHHPTLPDPRGRGLTHCLERAVRDAGVDPRAIGYVNAHGTGTEANDKTESRVLARFFGEEGCPPVSSSKSMFGHTLGAAGVLEATASLLSLRRGKLPPTASFDGPREACDLDYVPNEARPTDASLFLSTNSAFGGANCAVVAATGEPTSPAVDAPRHAVVITGLGAISPFGVGADLLREGLAEGRSALRPVDRHDVEGCSRTAAGLVPPFVPRRVEPRLRLDGLDRCSQYTAIAARRAMSAAGLSLRPKACTDVGFVLGLTHYPTTAEEQYLGSICRNGLAVPDLLHFPYLVLSSVTGAASRELLLKGPGTTLSAGHGAGLAAVARAADAVALGQVDQTLAGGTDEVNERLHRDLDALGRLAHHAPGEGSVLLVLESERSAEDRGAQVLARVAAHREAFWADPATPEQVRSFLCGLLDEAGLAAGDLAAVVPALERPSPHFEVAASEIEERFGPQRDLAEVLGWSPAVSALYGLAGALDESPGPILSFTLSRHGEARGLVTVPGEAR